MIGWITRFEVNLVAGVLGASWDAAILQETNQSSIGASQARDGADADSDRTLQRRKNPHALEKRKIRLGDSLNVVLPPSVTQRQL
jgi:hypothetical protein